MKTYKVLVVLTTLLFLVSAGSAQLRITKNGIDFSQAASPFISGINLGLGSSQNLSSVLNNGNTANKPINFNLSNTALQIGNDTTNTGTRYDLAIGFGANSTNDPGASLAHDPHPNIAIGHLALANGSGLAVALGHAANATQAYSTALGTATRATGRTSTAIGIASIASETGALALGNNADATNLSATAIGDNALAEGGESISIGTGSEARGQDSIALGTMSEAEKENSVAIGESARAVNRNEATFGSIFNPLSVNVTGNATVHENLNVKGDINVQGSCNGCGGSSGYPIAYSSGHTLWSSGLSNEEINRWNLQSGEQAEFNRLEVSLKGGGSNNNVSVELVEEGSQSVLGLATAGNPITSISNSSTGATVTLEITNTDTRDITASVTVSGRIS